METGAAVEEFITIVPVGESKPAVQDPAFVTVLTVGAASGAAEVIVRRPRAARLGLGLKFEGGSAAAEKVRRLLVQSCAEDSPAAKACAPWGKLIPGDEILAIDGVSVSNLTRIECVRRLKDSDETLVLLVRHFETEKKIEENDMATKEKNIEVKNVTELTRPTTLPPPVPPRKLGKKNSFKDKAILQTVGEQNALVNIDMSNENDSGKEITNHSVITHPKGPQINKLSRKSSFDSHIHRQNKESFAYLRKGSPEEVRRLVRRLSDGKSMPPEAEVYIDLLSNEWERCLVMGDAESDDTGSSISTVVDRLGSMASSVENSIPSTPIMQPKSIDIQKVLNSIENIDTDILKDMTSANFLDKRFEITEETKKVEVKSFTNSTKLGEITSKSFSENIIATTNKQQNDKNNNITQTTSRNVDIKSNTTKSDENSEKQNLALEKPQPMPRNTKVERSVSEKKRRPIPEPVSQPVPEPLLTPTKKTCIETWLQRSEAEMNTKNEEKIEEGSVPEILPRLIDFVPKTQFKESEQSSVCVRPTTAPPPPPPPVETREDGSGASLDTIGELDESCDVTDNAKPTQENDAMKSKCLYERNFWDDRVSKSDAEDKSLSNDETPLPTCPRQPPDGVETPSDAIEKTPDLPTRLPPRISTGWTSTRPRFSYSSRTQDARSEASVKDKIAMFSTDLATSSDRLDKCGTLPMRSHSTIRKNSTPYTNTYSDVSSLDRRLTKSQDNLDDTPRTYKRNSERPEVLGAFESNTKEIKGKKINQLESSNKPLFYGSTSTLPSEKNISRPTFHMRSISDDNSKKSSSSHKSNLEYLIEQRKKSMSKLRGLVIPEVQSPIVDLPEIKVQDPLTKTFMQNSLSQKSYEIKRDAKISQNKSLNLSETKWKTNFLPNNIPKYSPAFKRKSLQVYTPSSLSKESTPERKLIEKIDTNGRIYNSNNYVGSKPINNLLEFSKATLIKTSQSFRDFNKSNLNGIHDYKNVEIKICTTTDVVDSDNDSAMSSTQSSYRSSASSPMHIVETMESDSSHLSPRITHYSTYSFIKTDIPNKSIGTEKSCEEYIKRNVCRSMSSDTNISLSSSAGSAATSGSQASCSSLESSVADSDKRKVSKVYNVDTINRRNILASAKCRSGRDIKLQSPVVETKFSHESYNRSPSPTNNTPDRLSTLTSVSAIANKGDNRRRNKLIVDTDSDSDEEVNVRQRKSDYKNARLKRNSSSSNKNKIETNQDPIKIEEVPSIIRDEKLNESSKLCLNEISKTLPLQSKLNVNSVKIEKIIEKKNDKRHGISSTNESIISNCVTTKNIVIPNDSLKKSNEMCAKINEKVQVSTTSFRLKKGSGAGVGLILAGGIDCEAKDVTVHRVLEDSIAAKAGIKRGSKVRSINGITMMGLTHAQSVTILKEHGLEVVIEIENEIQESGSNNSCGSENAESKGIHQNDKNKFSQNRGNADRSMVTVILEKAGGGAGLGFGLDGGRDSPQGDRPLTIKKLFAGGAAAQSGRVEVGAELISAGGQSMEGFTRTQAWAALKALPPGPVALVLRNP